MIQIKNVLIDEDIHKTYFDCDLSKCKGGCCTFPGEMGAPLLEEELELIHQALPEAKKYLSEKHIDIIEKEGFYQNSFDSLTTQTVNDEACVFVYFEGDVALCALEKAYREGRSDFKKPISCHLFPIRVGDFSGDYLYYEKFDVCKPALPNGRKKKIKIHQSVKEALIRKYGETWYKEYVEEIKEDL